MTKLVHSSSLDCCTYVCTAALVIPFISGVPRPLSHRSALLKYASSVIGQWPNSKKSTPCPRDTLGDKTQKRTLPGQYVVRPASTIVIPLCIQGQLCIYAMYLPGGRRLYTRNMADSRIDPGPRTYGRRALIQPERRRYPFSQRAVSRKVDTRQAKLMVHLRVSLYVQQT
jgi:hypothetical protein